MKRIAVYLYFSLHLITIKAQTGKDLSLTFLNNLSQNKYDSCYASLDTSINQEITADMLKQIWESLPKYIGEYKGYSDIRYDKDDTTERTIIRCDFEKMKLDMKVAHNKYKKIVGLLFVPPKNDKAYEPPSYFNPNKFYESKPTVKTGTHELPAVLCVPNNISDPPVVILLAGSGANDKDETFGALKVLKDVATGLACNGVASLRYDKRTYKYGNEVLKHPEIVDLNYEVIEDALSAIELLRNNPVTKNSKIYIVGHSLGAMCAPLIASKSKSVSGIILMAGNARPLEDVLIDQYKYLASLDTSAQIEKQQKIAETEKQIKIVKDPKQLKNAKASELPLGLESHYWQSFVDYNQVKVAKKLKQPILVLNGERDYQVTMKEFNIWKEQLGGKSKNQFKSYTGLNHMFMKGEGKPNPQEYEKPGNVQEEVILDMVKWIKSQ